MSSFGYSGQYADKETGLVYYGKRFYNPDTGRFINKDPIGLSGGHNLYAFVGNNPMNSWDVRGNITVAEAVAHSILMFMLYGPDGDEPYTLPSYYTDASNDSDYQDGSDEHPYNLPLYETNTSSYDPMEAYTNEMFLNEINSNSGPNLQPINYGYGSGVAAPLGSYDSTNKSGDDESKFKDLSDQEKKYLCNTFLNPDKFDYYCKTGNDGYYHEYSTTFASYSGNITKQSNMIKGMAFSIDDDGIFYYVNGKSNKNNKGNISVSVIPVEFKFSIKTNGVYHYISSERQYHSHVYADTTSFPYTTIWTNGPSQGDYDYFNWGNRSSTIVGNLFDGLNSTYYQFTSDGIVFEMTFNEMRKQLNCDK